MSDQQYISPFQQSRKYDDLIKSISQLDFPYLYTIYVIIQPFILSHSCPDSPSLSQPPPLADSGG